MNKKGFIATSILYSFFIVFCAMLLTYIGILGHNSILVNKEKDLINEELHSNIYLSNADIGTYFRLNVCSRNDNLFQSGDTINYILIKKDISINNYTLLSSVASFKLNSFELLNDLLDKIYIKYKDNVIPSRSMSKDDYTAIKNIQNDNEDKLKNKILNIDIDYNGSNLIGYYLLANIRDNYYSGSESYKTYIIEKTESNGEIKREIEGEAINATNTLSNLSNMYIRLTFDMEENYRIISGDGTYSNPYIMEGGAKCN